MKLRRKIGIVALVLVLGGAGATYWALHHPKPVEVTRSAKLLTMAAEEAGAIDSLDDRLTRQLNIADLQIQCGQKSEAIKTLTLAVSTLQVREKSPAGTESAADGPAKSGRGEETKQNFDEFRRIAGWTSVAELAHAAGDLKMANAAYIDAVEALNSVQPEIKRAEYVMSLSEICYTLRGQNEATQLLVKGGQWAQKITNQTVRRYALATFARQLTNYDDLEDARIVMRNEADARWRSDMFAALARQNITIEQQKNVNSEYFAAAAPAMKSVDRARETKASGGWADEGVTQDFNKNLHYAQNYRNDDIQRGMAPR
jgi:hypothetical protein